MEIAPSFLVVSLEGSGRLLLVSSPVCTAILASIGGMKICPGMVFESHPLRWAENCSAARCKPEHKVLCAKPAGGLQLLIRSEQLTAFSHPMQNVGSNSYQILIHCNTG